MAQIMTIDDPITARDFSRGRISKSAVSPALVPINSVANSINVDYSEIIGSGIVRKGKTKLQSIVSSSAAGQSQTSGSDTSTHVYDVNWFGQTFTPDATTTQDLVVGVTLKLYRVGNPVTATVSIRAASGNLPNGGSLASYILDASTITASTSGALYTFWFVPFAQTAGDGSTQYSVVIAVDGDAGNYVVMFKNASGGYSGGQAASSTNSGSTWTADTGKDFYFSVLNPTTSYNTMPLGNYGFLLASAVKGVLAYNSPITSTGIIFYYDTGNAVWRPSDQKALSASAKIRFVTLNGRVFMANGTDAMKSSGDDGATWQTTDCITTNSVVPSLLIVAKNRMLASGYSGFRSRVYFSAIVDPNSNPFLTWNTDPATGDWIDINPDAGGVVTGFANTSTLTLVFKNNAMYRLNAIAKTVDSENIFNVGCPSQESITQCLGVTYFYSGNGIYQTDGTFPQQISRLGVQDFIDAISDSSTVFAGNDGFNVYFSIGSVTITFGPEDARTYSNVVLKFSPRDQNWQVFTYSKRLAQFTNFGAVPTVKMTSVEYSGNLSDVVSTTASDDGLAIPYSLETQEQEFGNRAHTKVISDRLVVYTKNGGVGMMEIRPNDSSLKSANMQIPNRVNVGAQVNFSANFFTFRWQGEAKGSRPIFEGYHLPRIQDLGIIN